MWMLLPSFLAISSLTAPEYVPGSPEETNLNSLLTSLINSGTTYNNFAFSSSSSPQDTLYGPFQCRGDLSAYQCSRCVSPSVSQVGTIFSGACSGAWQLKGCFVNSTFLGVEDKAEVVKKCGSPTGYDSDALTRRDAVLGFIDAWCSDSSKAY